MFLVAGKEKSFIRLNYFGPKKVVHVTIDGKAKTDTAFYRIPGFSFYDQHGILSNPTSFNGRIWVAYFVNIHDKEKAPAMAVLMNRVEERSDLDSALRLVTFNLDSESAKSMRDYANTVHAGKRRLFFSGNAKDINDLAIEDFYKPTNMPYQAGFNYFFLIDKEGHIRGIYNGTMVKDIDRLIDEIAMMEAEYYVKDKRKLEKEGKDNDAI